MKYYYFHILTAPELSWVAVNEKNQVVGYVLGKPYDGLLGRDESAMTMTRSAEQSHPWPCAESTADWALRRD